MNGTNWTEEQWKAYEDASVWIPLPLLESLILASQAHYLGIKVSSDQKRRWRDAGIKAMKCVDKVIAKVKVI